MVDEVDKVGLEDLLVFVYTGNLTPCFSSDSIAGFLFLELDPFRRKLAEISSSVLLLSELSNKVFSMFTRFKSFGISAFFGSLPLHFLSKIAACLLIKAQFLQPFCIYNFGLWLSNHFRPCEQMNWLFLRGM